MTLCIVMNMQQSITITSKGQTTIPAKLRHKLGISNQGGILSVSFNERKNEIVISKPVSARELNARFTSFIKPGTVPLTDVDSYYQANRQVK